MAATATPAGAGLIVVGTYLVLAFNRFGLLGLVEVRATSRIVLTGVYGWLWLVVATRLVVWWGFGQRHPSARLIVLLGHGHLPLLLAAVFVQFGSVNLNTTGFSIWIAVFSVGFWMPAMLVMGTATAFTHSPRRALLAVATPYAVWLWVVGRSLWRQVGHLL